MDFIFIFLFVSFICVFDCGGVRTAAGDIGAVTIAVAAAAREEGGGEKNDEATNSDGNSDSDSGGVTKR